MRFRYFPMGNRIGYLLYGIEAAFVDAEAALYAEGGVDGVDFVGSIGDGVDRAGFGAFGAAYAGVGDGVSDHLFAGARAANAVYVLFVFVAEVFQGGEHGVGRGFAQSAKGGFFYVNSQLF